MATNRKIPIRKARFREWGWTWFGFDNTIIEWLNTPENHRNPEVTYMLAGVETCPKTGKLHLQGLTIFKNPVSFSGAMKAIQMNAFAEGLKPGFLSEFKKPPAANIAYCKKEGKVVVEWGEMPQQGQVKANNVIRDMVGAGANMAEVAEVANNFAQLRFAEKLIEMRPIPKRGNPPQVHWFWGPTGSGKTRTAIEEATEHWGAGEVWISGGNLRWWQGYHGQKAVIIDDFRSDFCSFVTLLRVLDRYPFSVEVKGGSAWLGAEEIWITCPGVPEWTFSHENAEDVRQLLRRVTEIREFTLH